MANNRMYLVFEPTGLAIGLGKRMGWGWYVGAHPLNEARMNLFFDKAIDESEGDQDAFVVVLESDNDWEYVSDPDALSEGMLRMRRVANLTREAVDNSPNP